MPDDQMMIFDGTLLAVPRAAAPFMPRVARAARSNDPMAGLDRKSALGRRTRDLMQSIVAARQDTVSVDDVIAMAQVRKCAELIALAEDLRDKVLKRGYHADHELSDLVKLEGAADRALRRVGLNGFKPIAGNGLVRPRDDGA